MLGISLLMTELMTDRRIFWSCTQAYFRAAKAALDLKEFEQARTVCQQGIERQADFPELAVILKVGMAAAAVAPYCNNCYTHRRWQIRP